MRKNVAILLIFVLCFIVVGCTEIKNKKPSEIDLKPGKFELYDLSIYDTETKKQIYLGMPKKEVDSILGEPVKAEKIAVQYSYDGFCVAYRDDKVVYMSIHVDDISPYDRFITNRNISLGDNKKDVVEAYGADWQSEKLGTYIILRKDNQFVLLEISQIDDYKEYDTNNIFFISFKSNDKDKIDYISISDYNYGRFLK
jgi:hypothetical protein